MLGGQLTNEPEKMEITIKKANVNDVSIIAPLLFAYRKFYKREEHPIEEIASFVKARFNTGITIFLAMVDGTAVGIAQLYSGYSTLSFGKFWVLYDFYIDQTYRGQGIGKRLLNSCKDFAKRDGAFRLELKTDFDNDPANALYRRSGFVRDNHYIHYQLPLDNKLET